MAYFPPYIDTEGIHIPTYQDVIDKLVADYKAIFGDDVNLEEGTLDYQLLSVFARCLDDYSTVAVQAYNARNPSYAEGDALDTLVELNGVKRRQPTRSTAYLQITGTPGATIPAESQAIDPDGNLWTFRANCTLDGNGAGTVEAACETYGPVGTYPGTEISIYTPDANWYSVTFQNVIEVGENLETDANLRKRREANIIAQNNCRLDAIVSGIMNAAYAQDVMIHENNTPETDAQGVPANSLAIVVKGGTTEGIAQEIWNNKAPGVGLYGSTEYAITDAQGHEQIVRFSRPTTTMVVVRITVKPLSGYDSVRHQKLMKNAISNDLSSVELGGMWDVTRLYRAVYNALADDGIPVIVQSVSATTTGTSGHAITEYQCAYNEVLLAPTALITITESE